MQISDRNQQLLEKHLQLVLDANEKVNITRITSYESGMVLHVEDSLVGLDEVAAAPEGMLADLGSGAGFPGIPLAIVTGRQTLLVESVKKKATCLTEFMDELGLSSQVEVCALRSEELAKARPNSCAVVVARALSSLPSLMELASPLLQEGGKLVCYKSGDVDEEIQASLPIQEKLAMYYEGKRDTLLSDGETRRSIIVFQKKGEPTVKLPRHEGQAQKRPYRS